MNRITGMAGKRREIIAELMEDGIDPDADYPIYTHFAGSGFDRSGETGGENGSEERPDGEWKTPKKWSWMTRYRSFPDATKEGSV